MFKGLQINVTLFTIHYWLKFLIINIMNINTKIMKKEITVIKENGENLVIKFGIVETNHKYFSITADLYKGKGRSDSSWLAGGQMHDEILAVRPDLKPLVDLHLSNDDGVPMYATENGWYYFTHPNKFGKKIVMKHLRIDEETYDELDKELRENYKVGRDIFNVFCYKQHKRWKQEAEEAKKFIEKF